MNTLYFNPIFDAGSNHGYDTQDYYKIDPYFGTQKDWENLVKHANQRGMRIVLDGVFNHLSSDSPFFDRYHHYASGWRLRIAQLALPQLVLLPRCAGRHGHLRRQRRAPNSATYDGWFGFDSIPVINKSCPQVQEYFLTEPQQRHHATG